MWNAEWTSKKVKPESIFINTLKDSSPNINAARIFECLILNKLKFHEHRLICRLISGKYGLNAFLFKIKRVKSPECNYCSRLFPERKIQIIEDAEHLIMHCLLFEDSRRRLIEIIQTFLPATYHISLSTTNLLTPESK